MSLRRGLEILVVLLTLGGIPGMIGGAYWTQWRQQQWHEQELEVAEGMCRPGETFAVLRRRQIGGKTFYTYNCIGPNGHRRNLSDDLLALSPLRQWATWMPLLASLVAFLSGILIASFVLGGRPRRRRR